MRDPRHLAAELRALPSLRDRFARRDARVLTTVSPLAWFPPDRSVPGSLFATEGVRRVFSTLVLGSNVRTFLAPWSKALYWYLNELVAEHGELIVPALDSGSAGLRRGWSQAALEALFAQSGENVDSRFVRLRGRASLPRPSSVLPWFVGDLAGIVHAHILARSNPAALQAVLHEPHAQELIVWGMDEVRGPAPAGDWPTTGAEIDLTQQLSSSTRSVTYLMSGLAHKAAAIRFAVVDYGRSGAQTVVDVGGGFGFLAAELVLDDDLDVGSGLTVERDPSYAAGALRMYRALPRLSGRLRMALGPAERYGFTGPATVVTMMSSLLYVPREDRRALLDRAWDCLQSGGILVVYEVLRTDPPLKDDAIQYTAAEIDRELARYGAVVRLSATTLRELSAAEAAEATVFRVVVKP